MTDECNQTDKQDQESQHMNIPNEPHFIDSKKQKKERENEGKRKEMIYWISQNFEVVIVVVATIMQGILLYTSRRYEKLGVDVEKNIVLSLPFLKEPLKTLQILSLNRKSCKSVLCFHPHPRLKRQIRVCVVLPVAFSPRYSSWFVVVNQQASL